MIIHNLHVVSIIVQPLETDAPLMVNTNAVLAFPVSAKGLQPVPWRSAQVIETRRKVKLREFAKRHSMNPRGNFPALAADPQILRDRVRKTHDHTRITGYVHNVSRYYVADNRPNQKPDSTKT